MQIVEFNIHPNQKIHVRDMRFGSCPTVQNVVDAGIPIDVDNLNVTLNLKYFLVIIVDIKQITGTIGIPLSR